MPTRSLGGGRYQYGTHGKVYSGLGAKAKADRQGRAIQAAKARVTKKSVDNDMAKDIGYRWWGETAALGGDKTTPKQYLAEKKNPEKVYRRQSAPDKTSIGDLKLDEKNRNTTIFGENHELLQKELTNLKMNKILDNINKYIEKADKDDDSSSSSSSSDSISGQYDIYSRYTSQPTLDEDKKTFGDPLTAYTKSKISDIMSENASPKEDIRKRIEREIDDRIRKASKRIDDDKDIKQMQLDYFISKNETNVDLADDFYLVRSGIDRPLLALFQKNGRPPKEWWDNCVARAKGFADDPAAFCGRLHFGPEYKPEEKSMDLSYMLSKTHTPADTLKVISDVLDTLNPREEGEPVSELEEVSEAVPEDVVSVGKEPVPMGAALYTSESEGFDKDGNPWNKEMWEKMKQKFGEKMS